MGSMLYFLSVDRYLLFSSLFSLKVTGVSSVKLAKLADIAKHAIYWDVFGLHVSAGTLMQCPDGTERCSSVGEMQGSVYKADLSYQGMVSAEGEVFDSPNAFSLAVKRRTNPSFKVSVVVRF